MIKRLLLKKSFASIKNNLILKILGHQVFEKTQKKMVEKYFTSWLIIAGESIKTNNNLSSHESSQKPKMEQLESDFEEF